LTEKIASTKLLFLSESKSWCSLYLKMSLCAQPARDDWNFPWCSFYYF